MEYCDPIPVITRLSDSLRLPVRLLLTAVVCMAVSAVGLTSCGGKGKVTDRSRLEQLRGEAAIQASRRNFGSSDSLGRILYSEAVRAGDDVYTAYGLICQSYYDYSTGDTTLRRKKLAEEALSKALETTNDTLISRAYNLVGSYSALHDYDFAQAIYYFGEAKRYAEAAGAKDFAMVTDCNISEIYHSIGDTLGITYDLDIYGFAKETDNPGLMRSAAQHVAEHYLRSPSTASQALPYISSIDSTAPESRYIHDRLMGDCHQILGNWQEAERYYRQAMASETDSPTVYLSYARLLNEQGKYQESLDMLRKAESRLGEQSVFNTYKMQLLELRADNLRRLGRDREALENMTAYVAVKDSIQDFRNQQQVNKYRIRYELGKKEIELTQSRASVRTRNVIVIAVSAIALIVILALVIYYKRRNRMLSVIIDRQRELNSLRSRPAVPVPTPDTPASVPSVGEGDREIPPGGAASDSEPESAPADSIPADSESGGISEAKKNEIWARIQYEINVNRIYRDASLSRDMFSEKVGCNHTWFSQVIKEKSGLSYPQFMNQQRIEEALIILSDPASSMTHEELWRSLGFLSKATFYSSFKSRMSMSPAEFRRRSLEQL